LFVLAGSSSRKALEKWIKTPVRICERNQGGHIMDKVVSDV